jgi:hypothetical protein
MRGGSPGVRAGLDSRYCVHRALRRPNRIITSFNYYIWMYLLYHF